jgi:hypothetical protein
MSESRFRVHDRIDDGARSSHRRKLSGEVQGLLASLFPNPGDDVEIIEMFEDFCVG